MEHTLVITRSYGYLVGRNPARSNQWLGDDWINDGAWDTEEQAYEAFFKDMIALLNECDSKVLTVRRKPVMEKLGYFNEDKHRYLMMARFNISELKPRTSGQ